MNKQFKIQLGLRVAIAGLFLATCNWLAFLVVLVAPIIPVKAAVFGLTSEDEAQVSKLLEGLTDKTKATIKTELETALSGTVKSADFEARMKDLGISKADIDTLKTAVEKQGIELQKLFGEKKDVEKTVHEIVKEKKEEMKGLVTGQLKNLSIEIPYQTKITRASAFPGGTTIATVLPGIGEIPVQNSVISGMFRHAPVGDGNGGVIRYMDVDTITRNAAMVAEGGLKPTSDMTWVERVLPIEKIADSIPVSKEAFNDYAFIESEIRRLLEQNITLVEDAQLYAGNGTSPNLKGVYTTAPAFNPTTYAADTNNVFVADATLYDLIAILRVQIMNGKDAMYNPDYVLMNPSDILRYKLAKGVDGHYVLPPFISADGTRIDGMLVKESSRVTKNTLVIGDFRYGTIYDREAYNIQMGWVNDQFLRNTMTILAEKRLALLIRNIHADAFLKVTNITAAITAITAA